MRVITGVACMVLSATTAGAVDLAMERAAVDAAISLGLSRVDRDRIRYHAGYRVAVDKPPIDYLEIITPFRLLVLTAETSVRTGDRSFGQRQALALLAATDGRVDVRVELTFHPLNNYVDVPGYLVRLETTGGAPTARTTMLPDAFERLPRFGPRVDGTSVLLPIPGGVAPGRSQPLLGGTLVAHFGGRVLNPEGTYDVVVEEAGKELGRGRVDFAKLR